MNTKMISQFGSTACKAFFNARIATSRLIILNALSSRKRKEERKEERGKRKEERGKRKEERGKRKEEERK
jgi:hypothetical protein